MRYYKLLKIDSSTIHFLNAEDKCYYFADYYSVSNIPDASQHNPTQLIRNFKKPMNRKGRREWRYKQCAIEKVSEYLVQSKTNKAPPFFYAHTP